MAERRHFMPIKISTFDRLTDINIENPEVSSILPICKILDSFAEDLTKDEHRTTISRELNSLNDVFTSTINQIHQLLDINIAFVNFIVLEHQTLGAQTL